MRSSQSSVSSVVGQTAAAGPLRSSGPVNDLVLRQAGTATQPLATFVGVILWIIVASSWFVMVEPAPYDLLMIGLMALLFAIGLRVPAELGIPLLALSLFILANIVSIIAAPQSSLQPLGSMIFYLALTVYLLLTYVLIASMVVNYGRPALDILWSAWIFAAVIASLLAIGAFFDAIPASDLFLRSGRAKGAFKDPNVFGPFLIPPALIVLSRISNAGFLRSTFYAGVFALCLAGLFLSFSRGAWGNFILALLLFAGLQMFARRSLKQYLMMALGAVAVLLIALAVLLAAQNDPRVKDMLEKRLSVTQSYDVEAGGRFWVQRQSLKIAGKTPLGVGPNRTETLFGMNPHNVYLKTLVENGWLGGLSYLALVLVVLLMGFPSAARPWALRDSAVVVFASLAGIVAESIIIDTLHWRHLFLLLGMMSGLAILERNSRRQGGLAVPERQ